MFKDHEVAWADKTQLMILRIQMLYLRSSDANKPGISSAF